MDQRRFEEIYEHNKVRFLDEWKQYLSFASISSVSKFRPACIDCGRWMASHLEGMGFRTEWLEADGVPSIYAVREGQPDAPVVMLYGHFDVQPTGDLSLWDVPPFKPIMRDGRMYGRGARDNKGQNFFWIKAFDILQQEGLLNCTVKILLDGEEESGSQGLFSKLNQWRDKLRADVLVVSETAGCSDGDPAIIVGLRGASHVRLRVRGANRELHSGNHGGRLRNPATELVRALSELHDEEGKIAIPGFYDNVIAPSPLERQLAAKLPFDIESYQKRFDIRELCLENGYTPVEQVSFRPSLDINGIASGSRGEEIKTSIPAYAEAALSMRLVPYQDPTILMDVLVEHLRGQLPFGMELDVLSRRDFAPPFRCDVESNIFGTVREALYGIVKNEVYFAWAGATLPIIPRLVELSGAEAMIIGFGLEGDNEHGPNESFSVEQFRKGFLFSSKFLTSL